MKKNILFAVRNMNIGGVEKSLISLLNSLDPSEYDIDVLLLEKQGGFLNEIPAWVRVIVWDDYSNIRDELNLPPMTAIKRLAKSGKIFRALRLTSGFISYKINKNILFYYKQVFRGLHVRGLKTKYDVAISFTSLITYLSYTVMNYVSAERYFGWIHFDVNQLVIEKKSFLKLHEKMSKVYVVSQSGKKSLCKLFPTLTNKCYVRYNVLNKSEILQKSNEGIDISYSKDSLSIVTVSRLSYEKGIDLAIDAATELLKVYPKFKWYIVGEGKEYSRLKSMIDSRGLRENFLMIGKKKNPLPYIKYCDIYVQPSRTEGYCTTTNEAKVLSKPIIVTDVNGMREQFIDKETALIVPKENSFELFKALYFLCKSEAERNRLSSNIDRYGFVEEKESVNSIFD